MTRSPRSASSGTWWKLEGSRRQRAEEHGRGRETVEAVEQGRHAGQRDDQLRHVAGALERGDGVGEQHQRDVGLAVGRVQAGRVPREEALEELDAMLAHERDALVPRRERAAHIRLGERHPRDPQRVRNPVGVAERPRRGDGFLGEREGLVDAAGRLETIDVGGDAVAPIASVGRAPPRR